MNNFNNQRRLQNLKSISKVSPCGHQALCRLCFIKNIQQVGKDCNCLSIQYHSISFCRFVKKNNKGGVFTFSAPLLRDVPHQDTESEKQPSRKPRCQVFFTLFFTLIPMTIPINLINLMMIRGGQGRQRSFPSSVSGYQLPTLSKSQSHYSVHSGEHHHCGDD